MKNRIKELRLEKGLSQEELGKVLNVSGRTIGHYENGSREPTPEALNKLADFFGVTIDYLLCRLMCALQKSRMQKANCEPRQMQAKNLVPMI